VSLCAAVDLFIAAKAVEGASARTLERYRMITGRAVRRFGSDRPVDRLSAAARLHRRGRLARLAARAAGHAVARIGSRATSGASRPSATGARPRRSPRQPASAPSAAR